MGSKKCSHREEPGSDCSIDSTVDTDKENDFNGDNNTKTLINENLELISRNNLNSDLSTGCVCKSSCKTKACPCRKAGPYCSSVCKCLSKKCSHREEPDSDCSIDSTVDTDKENDVNGDNNTKTLINGNLELTGIGNYSNSSLSTPKNRKPHHSRLLPSIVHTPNSGADVFAKDSDLEATPKASMSDCASTP